MNRGHPSGNGRFDRHFHLHGFQNCDGLALLNFIVEGHHNLPDGTGNMRTNGSGQSAPRLF